jgi:hypothetical protein
MADIWDDDFERRVEAELAKLRTKNAANDTRRRKAAALAAVIAII